MTKGQTERMRNGGMDRTDVHLVIQSCFNKPDKIDGREANKNKGSRREKQKKEDLRRKRKRKKEIK